MFYPENKSRQRQSWNYAVLYFGWMSFVLCQRAMPSVVSHLQSSAGFSTGDVGSFFACFGITYSLSKLVSGSLYNHLHLSPNSLFCVGLSLSSMLCILFPLAAATGVFLSCAVRLVEGLTQGLGWPACVCIIKQWYPPSKLGQMYSLMSGGANLAGVIAPIFSAYVASLHNIQYLHNLHV